MEDVEERIAKDLVLFPERLAKLKEVELGAKEKEVVDLAAMYFKDTESWLEKGDLYTAFASISYAHGLLDAVLRTKGVMP